jgi:hypothetical protein
MCKLKCKLYLLTGTLPIIGVGYPTLLVVADPNSGLNTKNVAF